MKHITIIIVGLFFCLFSCQNSTTESTESNIEETIIDIEETHDVGDLNIEKRTIVLYPPIPQVLQNCINEKLSNFKYLKREGILTESENIIFENTNYPFFAKGDFNGDNKTDYSLILLDSDNKLKIVVFTSSSNSFTINFIDDYLLQYYNVYDNQIQFYLKSETKGNYDGESGNIYIDNDFLSISYMDASRTKYYKWYNGEYQKVDF